VSRRSMVRRLLAITSGTALALAPVAPPGPAGPAAAALGGPPQIETLGFAPLVGEFTVPGQPLGHIVIVWDEILDSSSVPAGADFNVTINGIDHQPTLVAHLYAGAAGENFAFGADGTSFMRIDLPTTYDLDDSVFLDYTPGATPIRDLSLTPAEAFTDAEVLAEDFGQFDWLTSVIDSYHGADRLVFVLTDPIEPASLPAPSQFAVTVDDIPVDVVSVADLHPEVGLAFIELTLASPVTTPDAPVVLNYTSQPGTLVSRYRGETFGSSTHGVDAVLIADAVSGTLDPGESLSTADPSGTTEEDPVAATITTTGSGEASIEESLVEGTSPTGYAFFGYEFDITMPEAPSAAEPNVITFHLDASIIPAGKDASSIQLFREGVLVADCTGVPGTADPSPCVSERLTDVDGNVTLTVLTVQASTWNMAIIPSYEFGGFLTPVDPVAPNLVKAGRAIPVKFSLGGDRSLDIFDAGSPSARLIGCGDLADTEVVDDTVTAGQSSLSYDAATDIYTYVWKTTTAWDGTCRRLVLAFADGSEESAIFDFRR
jgi:hypothetical protein